ncbi:hypothetical protein AB1Y20_016958 [Prymnesium parvum]|uniref:tRNA-uridine aminocarboxypropyltransferase n=1 Tax=Prymnesium parvum TaxID=97485 RepID=A0AB34ICH2_PRYPA
MPAVPSFIESSIPTKREYDEYVRSLSASSSTKAASHARHRALGLGWSASAALLASLRAQSAPPAALYAAVSAASLSRRLAEHPSRCPRCWHDASQRCICARLASSLALSLPVRALILVHYKEYFKASDDAKLLAAMLAPRHARLLVFPRDLPQLHAELRDDPAHTLLLWPAPDAATLPQWRRALPRASPWREEAAASEEKPFLRVVLLDAVYRNARTMFRHLHKHAEGQPPPVHVALHPKTLSVYKRAQQGYAQASAATVAKSNDPEALRVCTVEAFALLLEELGEPPEVPRLLVDGVVINNEALECLASVSPNPPGRRARRRQQQLADAPADTPATPTE